MKIVTDFLNFHTLSSSEGWRCELRILAAAMRCQQGQVASDVSRATCSWPLPSPAAEDPLGIVALVLPCVSSASLNPFLLCLHTASPHLFVDYTSLWIPPIKTSVLIFRSVRQIIVIPAPVP